jgi:hypothetical protein
MPQGVVDEVVQDRPYPHLVQVRRDDRRVDHQGDLVRFGSGAAGRRGVFEQPAYVVRGRLTGIRPSQVRARAAWYRPAP